MSVAHFTVPKVEETTSQAFSHVILFSWDGVQYNHFMELYNNNLTTLKTLVNETRLPILKTLITDHWTETNHGHPSMLSGFGRGSTEGCQDGVTVWENIETWNSSWVTGSVAGKSKFSNIIFPYARDDVDYWYAADTTANIVTDQSIQFIQNYSDSSFFLFVHYREPDYAGHYNGENSQAYTNAIIACDTQMERIISTLETEGIRDSTAVIITTDHGFIENGNGHSGSAWGALGSNPDLYTVWIACSAGQINTGEVNNRYWDQNDVAPTICSLIGLDDYRSRWPYIRGQALWERAFDFRNVAITDIQLSRNTTINETISIEVSVENSGNMTELPTISLYYDNNLIDIKTLVYPDTPLFSYGCNGSTRKVTVNWNPTGINPGIYTISANVSIVSASNTSQPHLTYTFNETDTSDNALVDGTVAVQQLLIHEIEVESTTYDITTLSSSNVTEFNLTEPTISFTVCTSGTYGLCNVTIPKTILDTSDSNPWSFLIDGENEAYTETENDTHTSIYFEHDSGFHTVEITGTWVVLEFPAPLIILPFLLFILAVILIAKRCKHIVPVARKLN